MTTINIQTTNPIIITALKSILALDEKTTKFSVENFAENQKDESLEFINPKESYLSDENAKDLIELVKKYDRNELEFYSLDEIKALTRKQLDKLTANS